MTHKLTKPRAASQGPRPKAIFLGSPQRAAEVTSKMLSLYRMPVQERSDLVARELGAKIFDRHRGVVRNAPQRNRDPGATKREKQLLEASRRAAADWVAEDRKQERELAAARPAMQAAALRRERQLFRIEQTD